MMKIALLTNSNLHAMSIIHGLKQRGIELSLCILHRSKRDMNPAIELAKENVDILYLNKVNWIDNLHHWLSLQQPDMFWVVGFPWKIPSSITSIASQGSFNFHFGQLPVYAGSDPVYWQVRNCDPQSGVCIHRITDEVDRGPRIWQLNIPVVKGETYGMYSFRSSMNLMHHYDEFMQCLKRGEELPAVHSDRSYWQKPTAQQLEIDWLTQSADDIEQLVYASNPKYGGASTFLDNMEMRILEVTPIDMEDSEQQIPGTIVKSDALFGIIVACINKEFLRITIMHGIEGYVSGIKLFLLGIKEGSRFYNKNDQAAKSH